MVSVRTLRGRSSSSHTHMGREDQDPEPVENSPVLTDKVCLIPGDAPVVRVEDAPGNARRIFTGVDIRATVEDVWEVLTNYEGLQSVVPNLVECQVVHRLEEGGARLWQVGRSTWRIFGRSFHFEAGTTLDVRLHPHGLCHSGLKAAGARIDASSMTSAEVRDYGRQTDLVRDVYPRPFSIAASGIPVRDITMQNVLGARSDFVHYQGVWRLQPLDGCALPGQHMMRLTFAVECEPHWFLPVAPVEGRIAAALVENMVAIRDHVEHKKATVREAASEETGGSAVPASLERPGPPAEPGQEESWLSSLPSLEQASAWLASTLDVAPKPPAPLRAVAGLSSESAPPRPAPPTALAGTAAPTAPRLGAAAERRSWFRRGMPSSRLGRRRWAARALPLPPAQVAEITSDMSDALSRAEVRLMERMEVGAAADGTLGAVTSAAADGSVGASVASSIAELSTAFMAVAEAAVGVEAETLLAASSAAAGVAALTLFANRPAWAETASAEVLFEAEAEACSEGRRADARWAWRAVLEQHPQAVVQKQFMGVPFTRADVERRWARFVKILDIPAEQALEIIETDATPLLVDSEDVAEILGRLAAISSREKALELIGMNPSLLVGGAAAATKNREKGFGVSTIVDVLYAGRLRKVLEDEGNDNQGKVAEIEFYSCVLSSLKPLVEIIQRGLTAQDATAATRRLFRTLQQFMPNSSFRVLLGRVSSAPDPWAYLLDQTRAGIWMAHNLVTRPSLTSSILPHSTPIMMHLPSIYTRLSILRPHIAGIVRILDPYLPVVEPHLDRIMERMDRIEPHLPYLLLHLDVLAKHCGPLLDHFDELMPYAEDKELMLARSNASLNDCYKRSGVEGTDLSALEACVVDLWDEARPQSEVEREKQDKSYLPRLLPYVDFLVPHLEVLAPHLPLVHPHLPHILPYMDDLLPYIPRFAAYPRASANADVLIGYLGWMLRVPHLPKVLYLPLVPRLVSKLSTVLPRWPIRRILEKRLRTAVEVQKQPVKSRQRRGRGLLPGGQ